MSVNKVATRQLQRHTGTTLYVCLRIDIADGTGNLADNGEVKPIGVALKIDEDSLRHKVGRTAVGVLRNFLPRTPDRPGKCKQHKDKPKNICAPSQHFSK